jgi:hypothetical protein
MIIGKHFISATIVIMAISFAGASEATIVTNNCASSNSCTLKELFSPGASIQIDSLLLSDWQYQDTGYWPDASNLAIGVYAPENTPSDPFSTPVNLFSINNALAVSNSSYESISYAFKVTGVNSVITDIFQSLGHATAWFYSYNNNYVQVNTSAGTSAFMNDIGTSSYYWGKPSWGGFTTISPLVIPVGSLGSVWVSTSLSVWSGGPSGTTIVGDIDNLATRMTITTTAPASVPVPVPAPIWLIGLGVALMVRMGRGRTRRASM